MLEEIWDLAEYYLTFRKLEVKFKVQTQTVCMISKANKSAEFILSYT